MLIETKVGHDNVVPTMVLKMVQVLRLKMEARLAKRQYWANMAAFHGRQNGRFSVFGDGAKVS